MTKAEREEMAKLHEVIKELLDRLGPINFVWPYRAEQPSMRFDRGAPEIDRDPPREECAAAQLRTFLLIKKELNDTERVITTKSSATKSKKETIGMAHRGDAAYAVYKLYGYAEVGPVGWVYAGDREEEP